MQTKVAAITGAYKGLGAALSKLLGKKGYQLVLGGRNKAELDKFISSIKGKTEAICVVMDVRKKEDGEHFIEAAVEKFGRLDLLINNAGIWKKTDIFNKSPEMYKEPFYKNAMDPEFVAKKIMEHIESPTDEWNVALRHA